MGRPKGSLNKNKKDPEKKLSPEKVKQEVKIPIMEDPLMIFVCRRCNGNFNSTEEYQNHDCPEQTYAVIFEEQKLEEAEQASPEKPKKPRKKKSASNENDENEGKNQSATDVEKKPRKPREKKLKEPVDISCQTCGKNFTRKYHLERHLIHTQCNPGNLVREEFNCEVCGKVFSRVDNLRMHLRAHLGVKSRSRDFQCPYCDKAFYGSSLLNIHIRSHTKVSSYKKKIVKNLFLLNRKSHINVIGKDATKDFRHPELSKSIDEFTQENVLTKYDFKLFYLLK